MAYPSVTNSFSNGAGNTIDATEVNANFTDVINGFSDGTKDLNMDAGTFAGAVAVGGFFTPGGSGTGIKNKKITFTTHANDSGTVTVAHGLTYGKILSCSMFVEATIVATTYQIPPSVDNLFSNTLYEFAIDATNVNITNVSASDLHSKPGRCLIYYEA